MNGDRITVVVHLPQDIDKISRLLERIADIWPNETINLSGEHGWVIEVSANADT